jgi:hypothetical protein
MLSQSLFTYTNYRSFSWHQTRLKGSSCSCQLRASIWILNTMARNILKTSTNSWVTWLEISFLLWKREFFVWCLLLLVGEQRSKEESDFTPTNNCVVGKKSSLHSSRIHENESLHYKKNSLTKPFEIYLTPKIRDGGGKWIICRLYRSLWFTQRLQVLFQSKQRNLL